MKIKILAVGKIKFNYLDEGIEDYSKRLAKVCDLEIIEMKEQSTEKMEEEKIKDLEGKNILKKLDKDSYKIVLDGLGKQFTSEEFSEMIKEVRDFKDGKLTFIIGGAFGLSEEVLKQADLVLSFSKMTFAHQLFRLVLLEQIYRSFEILKGTKYHK